MCVCVYPQAILAVRTITSETKDTIMLSIKFVAIILLNVLIVQKFERFLLTRKGRSFCFDVQFTCKVLYTLQLTNNDIVHVYKTMVIWCVTRIDGPSPRSSKVYDEYRPSPAALADNHKHLMTLVLGCLFMYIQHDYDILYVHIMYILYSLLPMYNCVLRLVP